MSEWIFWCPGAEVFHSDLDCPHLAHTSQEAVTAHRENPYELRPCARCGDPLNPSSTRHSSTFRAEVVTERDEDGNAIGWSLSPAEWLEQVLVDFAGCDVLVTVEDADEPAAIARIGI